MRFSYAELIRCLEHLQALRIEHGRQSEPFEIHASSPDGYTLDGVRRLAEQAVTDLVIGFRNPYTVEPDTQTLQAKIDALRGYADAVIAKLP